MSEPDHFRHDINALRALAVLSVIAYHFDILGAKSGYVGVDIFFVISGFLIGGQVSSQIAKQQFSAITFFSSRIRRIVPALVAMCAAVYIWGWLFQLPEDYKLLVRSALWAVFFVSNIAFSDQLGYFDLGSLYKPLLHTWSLSVEAQFYLLQPFFLILIFKLPSRFRLLATVAAFILSFGALLYMGSQSPSTVFYSFFARAWEFMIGCLVAWLARDAAKYAGGRRDALLATAWAALIATCFLLPKGAVWPGLWTLAPTMLAGAIILFGTGQTPSRLVLNWPVQHVGAISYSLYLWHWPLLICWNLTNGEAMATTGYTLWVLLGATWVLAWLSWRFVEQPFRANRKLWTTPRLYGGYAAILVSFTLAGVVIWVNKGMPARLPTYLEGAYLASRTPKDEGCWKLPRAEMLDVCDLGNPKATAPTVALVGDSHAQQLRDAFRDSLEGKQLSGYSFQYPLCEPAFPSQAAGGVCDSHNEDMFSLIERTPSIKTLVITIRQNNTLRVDRTIETIHRLLDKDYRIIFLGPLPEARRAVVQEWASTQFMWRKPVMEMAIARDAPSRIESYNQRLAYWRKATTGLEARYPGRFVALDLTDTFCDRAKCWFVREGVGILRDTDHLTLTGARLATSAILRMLDTEWK